GGLGVRMAPQRAGCGRASASRRARRPHAESPSAREDEVGEAAMTAEAGHNLIPTATERRAARTWLLPWATDRGWWHGPVLLVGILGLVRGVLLLVSHGPWFMNDSAEYLALADELYVPRVRPPGVAVFWQGVFAIWHSLDAVLLAQALVGIVAGVVLYCI